MRVNVLTVRWDEKKWPLRRGSCCREVAVSGGSTIVVVSLLVLFFFLSDERENGKTHLR